MNDFITKSSSTNQNEKDNKRRRSVVTLYRQKFYQKNCFCQKNVEFNSFLQMLTLCIFSFIFSQETDSQLHAM